MVYLLLHEALVLRYSIENLISLYHLLLRNTKGVELHADVIEHCKSSIAKWKTNVVDEQGDNSTIHFMTDTADIQIIKGNGLDIINSKGESAVGFDRIYIGAAVDKDALANISKLLSPGGILVGPGELSFAGNFCQHFLRRCSICISPVYHSTPLQSRR